MKYFADYLVSKGIITEEILVNALFEQMRTLPSIGEVVFQKKAIPSHQILQALKLQYEKKIDFKTACIELNLWNEGIEKSVFKEINTVQTPLSQVLVKSGATDISTITKALDEFLSTIENNKQKVEVPPPPPNISPSSQIDPKTIAQAEAASNLQKPPTKEVDPSLVDEFLSNLNPQKIESIKRTLIKMEHIGESEKACGIRELLMEIHCIRGLLRYTQLEKTESLVAHFEKACICILNKVQNQPSYSLDQLSTFGLEMMNVLEDLIKVLKNTSSESAFFSDSMMTLNFHKVFKNISDCCLGET